MSPRGSTCRRRWRACRPAERRRIRHCYPKRKADRSRRRAFSNACRKRSAIISISACINCGCGPASASRFIRPIARPPKNCSAMPIWRFITRKATAAAARYSSNAASGMTLEARLSLEADLERALERDEFELFYQPQVNLRDGSLIGAEALIRWRSPDRGFTSPDQFMPVVNATSMPAASRNGCCRLPAGKAVPGRQGPSPSSGRQFVAVPIPIGRSAGGGRRRAGRDRAFAVAARTGSDRKHPVGRRRKGARYFRPDSGAGRAYRVRRFRHRLRQSDLSEALCARPAQDRQVFRAPSCARIRTTWRLSAQRSISARNSACR